MKKLIVASLIALVAPSYAMAWGAEAAIAAAIGGFIVGRASNEPDYPPPVYYAPRPGPSVHFHYDYQPPVVQYRRPRYVCQFIPLYDAYGRRVSSVRHCDYVR